MDLRDPLFNKWHGCEDDRVLFRLRPDGGLQKKPPCADCNGRGVEECFYCEDIEECRPKCSTCQFIDMCDRDDFPDDDLPEVDFLKLKEAQDALDAADVPEDDRIAYPCSLSFKLKSYYIDKIDNGFIIYYHTGENGEHSHKRFVPDTESLSRFIDQHTDKS